jgi:hypothetical protein
MEFFFLPCIICMLKAKSHSEAIIKTGNISEQIMYRMFQLLEAKETSNWTKTPSEFILPCYC